MNALFVDLKKFIVNFDDNSLMRPKASFSVIGMLVVYIPLSFEQIGKQIITNENVDL
jgi:hypothetical protein